jgi:hypothetical protein
MKRAKIFSSSAAILGIEPRHRAAYLIVRCEACEVVYSALLPTVSGIPVGACTCATCGNAWRVTPADIAAALDRHWPQEPKEAVDARAAAVRAEAQSWAAHRDARAVLTYDGVPLADLLEEGSFPYFLWALHRREVKGDA